MPLLDMSLEEMRDYRPPLEEPDDFDAFWARTLEETRAHDLNAIFETHRIRLRNARRL